METKIDANVGTRYLAQGVVLNKRYTITKYLASGGFGHTYLATNTMGMQVVIKEFYISGVCSRDKDSRSVIVSVDDNKELYIKQKSKFIREAQRIYSLSHPNIVKVMDAFEENDTAYYVMDYIDGQSLAQMQKPIREDVVIHYLRQILSALEYVHNVDLLHLDIKPSNIMIDSHGNAILIDFGAMHCKRNAYRVKFFHAVLGAQKRRLFALLIKSCVSLAHFTAIPKDMDFFAALVCRNFPTRKIGNAVPFCRLLLYFKSCHCVVVGNGNQPHTASLCQAANLVGGVQSVRIYAV